MSNYIWCEDSGAGFIFWKKLFKIIYPEAIVESKFNNSRLRQAVSRIKDDGNQYYIIMDTVIDNPDVIREVSKLKRDVQGKENICLINIVSFEYVLLSFELLTNWVFAKDDWLKDDRKDILAVRQLLISGGGQAELESCKDKFPYVEKHNLEQVYAKTLLEITKNTGFETDKGHLGECFVNDCCEWGERREDDICGLDEERLDTKEKIKQIVEHSVLKNALGKVGL